MSNLYGHSWRQIRARRLKQFPLCAFCAKIGKIEPATVVDHVIPHRGDEELFFDTDNLQSLCKHCHDSHKQTQEKSGHLKGSDLDGLPLDPRHPWLRPDRAGDE